MIINGEGVAKKLWRNLVCGVTTIILGLAVALSSPAHAGSVPESNDPIKIVVTDATSQIFMSYVIGRMLQDSGYSVEYVAAGYYPQVQGLADGDLHFTPSLWSSNMGDGWMELFENGQVLDAGETHHAGVEAWYANDTALEVCPGLEKNWKLLFDCAENSQRPRLFLKAVSLIIPLNGEPPMKSASWH